MLLVFCIVLQFHLTCRVLQVYSYCKSLHVIGRGFAMKIIDLPRQMGIAVRQARKEAGLTQKKLAERADVSERLIIALELGDATGIRLDKLLKVLEALDLSLAVLGVGDDADEPKRKPKGQAQYAVVGFPDLDFSLPPELTLKSFRKDAK